MNINDAMTDIIENTKIASKWYKLESIQNPEYFPLEMSDDNSGLWYEMLLEFNPEDENVIKVLNDPKLNEVLRYRESINLFIHY